MSSSPTIQIQNLHHSFGKGSLQIPVLTDINLEIPAGEITILTGPSGSGKTTLLTLIPHSAGKSGKKVIFAARSTKELENP